VFATREFETTRGRFRWQKVLFVFTTVSYIYVPTHPQDAWQQWELAQPAVSYSSSHIPTSSTDIIQLQWSLQWLHYLGQLKKSTD